MANQKKKIVAGGLHNVNDKKNRFKCFSYLIKAKYELFMQHIARNRHYKSCVKRIFQNLHSYSCGNLVIDMYILLMHKLSTD